MSIGPAPMCTSCLHLAEFGVRCAAFPDRIPDEIWDGGFDHRAPHEGDHDVQFAQDPDKPVFNFTEFDKEKGAA